MSNYKKFIIFLLFAKLNAFTIYVTSDITFWDTDYTPYWYNMEYIYILQFSVARNMVYNSAAAYRWVANDFNLR